MINKFEAARIKFRDSFRKGIKPVDGRQPIPDELAVQMINELNLPKDAVIGVIDAFLILSTHLKEAGYTNIVVLENIHSGLTDAQEMYYDKVKTVCDNSGIKYYIPPMNNYKRCDMKFDVIIGNPPYQGTLAQKLWHDFLVMGLKNADVVSFVIPASVTSPGKAWDAIKNNLVKIDFNVKQHFKGIGSTFCRVYVDMTKEIDCTEIVTDTNEIIHLDVRNYQFLPPVVNNYTLSLYQHLTGDREWIRSTEYHTSKKNDWIDDNGSIEVLHTNAQTFVTSQDHPNNAKYRVAISLSGNPKFHVLHNKACSETCVWTECKSIDDAIKLCDYYNSPTIQDVVKTFKWSGFNSRLVIKLLGSCPV